MSWTFRNSNENGGGGSSTTVAVTVTSIGAGDVIIAAVGDGTSIDVTSVDDTGSAFTAGTLNAGATSNRLKFFYKLSSDKTGSVTYTATYASAASARELHVWAFTPSAAATLDTQRADGSVGSGTTVDTNAITTTGSDDVVVAACYHGTATTVGTQQINGVASTGTLDPGGNASSWYRIVAAPFTGNGTGVAGAAGTNCSNIIAFQISGGGGETVTVDKWFSPAKDPIRRLRGVMPSGTIGIKST